MISHAKSGCYSTEGHGVWLAQWGVYAPDGSDIVNFYNVGDGGSATTIDSNGNFVSLLAYAPIPPIEGYSSAAGYYDTSNILFFANYQGGLIGSGPGPWANDLYYDPNMDSAGASEEYVEHEVTIEVDSAFNEQRYPVAECVNSANNSCTTQVISQIVLPDQTSFTFKYDCDSTIAAQQSYCTSPGGQSAYYGGLTEMITPSGGTINYSYLPFFDVYADATLGLHSRSNGYGTWQYSEAALSQCGGPSGNGVWNVGCEQTTTTVEPNGRTEVTTNIVNIVPWPVSQLVTDGAGHNQSLTTTQWNFSNSNQWMGYGAAYVQKQWETETIWDSTGAAETKKTAYTYDSPQTGNVTVLQQWGYYSGTNPSFPSIPDVTTYTSYYAPTNSPIADSTESNIPQGGTNVIDKPTSITVCNNVGTDTACPGGGTRVSQRLIAYDQYGSSGPTQVTGVTNHDDAAYGVTQLVRGNPTSTSQWVSNGQYVTQSMTYDTTGQIASATDGDGYVTQYSYTDNYYVDNGTSSPASYVPSPPTHAYATTITMPTVHGHSFSTGNGYYYGNQKPAFTTDINGNSTYYHYSDPLDRLTQVVYPLGWMLTKYTSPTVTDVYTALSSPTPSSGCVGCLHTSIIRDGLQRVTETVRADGSKIDTAYNSIGLVQSASNPYWTSSDSTYGSTSYVYDIVDRVCMKNNPDNVLSQSATCTTKGSSAQEFSYVVDGGYKSDENGNTWGYFYDSLGRLGSVTEPNNATTQYTYDALGDLLNASQTGISNGQTPRLRSFTYDGLSRLVTATNSESGAVCYGVWSGSNCIDGHDGNGNLQSRTDARGVVTTYTYDAWNRPTSKSYSDGFTPISCYQYDAQGITNGNGRLANEWTQPSGTTCTGSQLSGFAPVAGQYLTLKSITAYDAMGRVLNEQQCTPNASGPGNCTSSSPNPFALTYLYDLAGHPMAYTNGVTNVPSVGTIVFGLQYDGAGRLQNLSSSWNPSIGSSSSPISLFTADPTNGYTPAGAIQNMVLGDNIFVNKTYDKRLRTTGEVATHP